MMQRSLRFCIFVVLLLCAGTFLAVAKRAARIQYSESRIHDVCMKFQKYTPDTDMQYQGCMKDNGLDPQDWE